MKLLLALLTTVALGVLVTPAALPGKNAVSVDPASEPVTATGGVRFVVAAGGGNRDFASVRITCSSGGEVVYGTIVTVTLDDGGAGTSQTIYPPASECLAELVKQMRIGQARVLGSVSFTVAP